MIIALSTYPEKKKAEQVAEVLVEKRLAACVSIMKIEQSVYRWQGKVEKSPEWLMIIKSTKKAYPSLERYIKKTHPHTVPEIVYMDVKGGLPAYLRWVDSSVSKALRVPLDLTAIKRAGAPSKASTKARKPKTLSK